MFDKNRFNITVLSGCFITLKQNETFVDVNQALVDVIQTTR